LRIFVRTLFIQSVASRFIKTARVHVLPLPRLTLASLFRDISSFPSVPDHTKRNVPRRRRTFTRVRYIKRVIRIRDV